MHRIFSSSMNSCPRCGKIQIITDNSTGERFCGNCGFVLTERSEESSAEWRSFSREEYENKSRTGIPTSLALHDMGLATVIGPTNKDAYGKPLSASMKNTIERLRTWNNRSQTHLHVEKNFRQAFSELNRLKDKLVLSDDVIEKTAYIYRKATEKGLGRGRSIQGLVAACLYAACRDREIPRTLSYVSSKINVQKKDVARCYRLILRELDLKMPVADPIKHISGIASRAGLSEKTRRKGISILKVAMENEITAGKDPTGIAAAALYLSCIKNSEKKSQKNISDAAGITEVTIRNRYTELKKRLKI